VPSPTIDWQITHHHAIEIEERHASEVTNIQGLNGDDELQIVRVIPLESKAANPAFDVTPARLVTGIITEQGVFAPTDLKKMQKNT